MNKSSVFSKALSLLLAVVMLMGVMSVGMIAGATDYPSWEAVTTGGVQQGDTVIVKGVKYKVKDGQWWVTTPPPGAQWEQVGVVDPDTEYVDGIIPADAMKNKSETMPNNQYRAIYYVTQWNWPGTYDPVNQTAVANIDVSKITHINYAFGHIATVDAQGNAFPGYVDVPDPAKLHALVELKKQNPNLKILLSIGGWGMDGFCPIASDANKRKIFANSCKQIMDEFGIDGIDIDWEYPGTIGDHLDVLTCSHLKTPVWEDKNKAENENGVFVDGQNYIKLLKEVRGVIGWDYLLTIASGVGYDWMCGVSNGELPDYLDFINIMCYDLYGDWQDHSNYNANLYPVPGEASDTGVSTGNPLSYDVVCDRLAYRGYPRDIMNIGIPFYGRDRAYNGSGAIGSGDASWITYRQVQELKSKGATVNWDSTCHASYLTGTVDGRTYDITYDDVRDIQDKMAWIQEKGYGGAMVWEYSQDDDARTLTNAIWEGLNGSGRKSAPPTPSYRFDGTKAGYTTGLDEPKQNADQPSVGSGKNTIWQSWRNYIGNHPSEVFYGGYAWHRIDNENATGGYTWMAKNHQGTFGWAPAYAPLFAQEPYNTPECITGGNFKVSYPAEWEAVKNLPETKFARNEAGKKNGSVNSNVLKISKIQPNSFLSPKGSTITWDVQVTGGTGSYTVTNEIWFSGLKFDLDGSVKYEKRRTGGPYPNPTAAARTDATGGVVQKEVQEGDKMDKITPTITGTAGNQKVSATFAEEGTYYCYTVVKDSAGNYASVFSQAVQIGEGLVVTPNPVNLKVGEKQQMTANQEVTRWSTTDPSVATIDSNTGLLTAVGKGTCQVMALYGDDGTGKRGYANVTVVDDGGTITVPGKEIVMKFDATKSYVDGSVYPTTQYATGYATLSNVNGTAMMPLRYIAEVSGFDVAYDEATQKTKVTNKANGEYLLVTPGSASVAKYSSTGALLGTTSAPSAFTMNNGVTMGPLRYTCEALGMFVNYQETSHGIYVTVTSASKTTAEALALIEKAYGLGL